MDFEENENSITAGTSTQNPLLQRKRAKLQVRPNMSCGINVSVIRFVIFYMSISIVHEKNLACKDQNYEFSIAMNSAVNGYLEN